MSSWKQVRFSEICDITRGGSPRPIQEYMTNDGVPWIKISDATASNSRFIEKTKEFIKTSGISKSREVFPDDLILSNSATPGIPKFMRIYACIHDGWLLLRNFNGAEKEFIYWLLLNERDKLIQQGNGSVFTNLKTDILKNHIVNIPDDIEEQKRIATILNNIQEKIELNTQINQTLEQIAQTIFKSWFIDFDPVHAKANALASGQTLEQATQAAMAVISGKNTQELHRLQTANPEQYQQLWEIAEAFPSGVDEEGVPRGWGYEKSENLFDVGIGKTPPRKEPEWFSENSNDIEWISIKDMGNSEVFVNKSSEYLLESAVNKFNVKRIPENTVILSFKLTVGRVGITTKETTTNEAIAHFRLCEKSYLTTEFLYLYLKNFDFNNLGSTSSIATAVNSKTIKEMEILYPTLEIMNVFQYRVSNIFKAIRANSEQRNCLEKIRDELLPKLLSGEV
ncbi:restriction endonuclease subunit S [Glaesserella parasuis]|uniref:restriction endonuclease subunit S n=1 Tax=Glaesserella parasuis TaxID=738 RepID=UPI0024370E3D|nr:restriction endonuclease subunit S [Glaesserella parasuis]MDG6280579.1 restriction endonuclease subunit S [Glaesserella parasuis]